MLILISGPCRSGTDDDPEKMAANRKARDATAWPVFQAGHIPMIRERVAQPGWRAAVGKAPGDTLYEEIVHPAAARQLSICDAVLRLQGESRGADIDIRQAETMALPIYRSLNEIPRG